ncbi:LacI family DNA-binding transcriptional regulator [Bifidobacterium sp. 82T24]|uniref:LacI family DNA-binding transcriptional regulator n=1 Tax=Bifidobacterium pluvialisilvae TaxID=2834436 RepID=UPI001C59586D|nr:LacI family DNA-binding transcriptional regulator [Bifidobacterium pluvialisilvae]MBW3087373.1 LacI family DNA-binding transcriptional regulator [Bifidobacterium pluvialisilvae]
MAKRTTIKDVAAAAGVSVTAVSLVLNNRPSRVSDETRDIILKAAKALNYVPNQVARTLVTQRSMLLALIVPDIQNLFFAALAKRFEDECRQAGYSLIIANTDDSRAAEHDVLVRLAARGVDGMFLIPAGESGGAPERLRVDVERCGRPVVLVDRMVNEPWCDGVAIDNRAGGRLAAQYLMECGHRRIACVSGDVRIGNAAERRDGFVEALAEVGLAPTVLVEGDYRHGGGYDAADGVVESGATAVFCCNDLMALGLMQRLRERGLEVPDDMSVMGYDGIAERFGFGFDLTTIGQKIGWLAHEASILMKGRIDGGGDAAVGRSIVIPPELIRRGSVAQP